MVKGWTSKTQNLFIKNCVFILTCATLQSCSKYSPFDTIHLLRHFFHHSKQFLNSLILMPFNASAIFCFTSSTFARHFPLKTFFTWGNKTSCSGRDWVKWHRGNTIFGQKLLNTQHGVGRCTGKSSIMKWANMLKESYKKITDAKSSFSQQRQLVRWYRWVPRTLT